MTSIATKSFILNLIDAKLFLINNINPQISISLVDVSNEKTYKLRNVDINSNLNDIRALVLQQFDVKVRHFLTIGNASYPNDSYFLYDDIIIRFSSTQHFKSNLNFIKNNQVLDIFDNCSDNPYKRKCVEEGAHWDSSLVLTQTQLCQTSINEESQQSNESSELIDKQVIIQTSAEEELEEEDSILGQEERQGPTSDEDQQREEITIEDNADEVQEIDPTELDESYILTANKIATTQKPEKIQNQFKFKIYPDYQFTRRINDEFGFSLLKYLKDNKLNKDRVSFFIKDKEIKPETVLKSISSVISLNSVNRILIREKSLQSHTPTAKQLTLPPVSSTAKQDLKGKTQFCIRFLDGEGEVSYFSIKLQKPFAKGFSRFAEKNNIRDINKLEFVYNGKKVDANLTPQQIKLKHNSTIFCKRLP